jgi:hypothetical protein
LTVEETDHVFALSVSAKVSSVPDLLNHDPTAKHWVLDEHETPFRELTVAPEGLGVVCTVHAVPFQTSASESSVPFFGP